MRKLDLLLGYISRGCGADSHRTVACRQDLSSALRNMTLGKCSWETGSSRAKQGGWAGASESLPAAAGRSVRTTPLLLHTGAAASPLKPVAAAGAVATEGTELSIF